MTVFSPEDIRYIIQNDDPEFLKDFQERARSAAEASFGRGVFIRGLIEISSHCRNNCLYCGLRAANTKADRYRLGAEEILSRCSVGYGLGFRTFVLQGGEDPLQDDSWVESLVLEIKNRFPDCALTLSLGEKSRESLERFRRAGADRYLLRHETFNPEHYSRLHPAGMRRQRRLECLRDLKALGYQTGTGFMVGSPYQTIDNIVEDILFIRDFQPEMIGIGPFIHHDGTPFGGFPDGSVDLTLKLISLLRLVCPGANIPATTALASIDPQARLKGILAGANVVMPNLSPERVRGKYEIYGNKAFCGAESAEGLEELRLSLRSIGYDIAWGRGDYKS